MRVISYNILDGGVGRADPLAEVIEANRPDVVALIEADDLSVVGRMAKRLKMDVVHAVGQSHAVALLSRYPVVESVNHGALRKELSKCLLEAKIEVGGEEMPLGVVHLHDGAYERDERRREDEIAVVLEVFESYRKKGQRHLIIGDFNATSPMQEIEASKLMPESRKGFVDNGEVIPRTVVRKILDVRYLDTFHERHGRGARATAGATFTTLNPGQRVDYCFAFGVKPEQINDAWIETDRLAQFASDHYPIGVELKW